MTRHIIAIAILLLAALIISLRSNAPTGIFSSETVPVDEWELWRLNEG